MDPFHVVPLAGDALDQCRVRVQQQNCGHRGRSGDPLYSARRTLHTGAGLLTDKQTTGLDALFTHDRHVHLEATWWIYQQMTSARRVTDRTAGQPTMSTLIDALSSAVLTELTELVTLGWTLTRRAADMLAHSPGLAPATARPKPSMAGSSTSVAAPSASATSPNTSPVPCWRPAASDPDLPCGTPRQNGRRSLT